VELQSLNGHSLALTLMPSGVALHLASLRCWSHVLSGAKRARSPERAVAAEAAEGIWSRSYRHEPRRAQLLASTTLRLQLFTDEFTISGVRGPKGAVSSQKLQRQAGRTAAVFRDHSNMPRLAALRRRSPTAVR
jgi:hypothetical protein